MSTLVFLHAHPDDEASSTSGSIARAVGEGHRVVVVFATNGDHGEAAEDLREGESVVDRRRAEAQASARIVGTDRLVWLGYADSGMTGWEQNDAEHAFSRASVDEAGAALAAILDEEGADVLVGYDWHGGYGHPDHVQVHRVAHRAADLAARRPRLLEVTMNRDRVREMMRHAPEDERFDPDGPMDDGNPMGMPEADIHWQVDVSEQLATKRAALQAHASQVSDVGRFMALPPEAFNAWFDAEFYVEPGRPAGLTVGWPFD